MAATARLRKQRLETRILVLTTSDSGADILRAVEAGATGYVLKDAPREEIYGAIRAAAEGKPLLAPDVAAHLVERVRWPSEEGLSGREVEVLELVARGKGNKEIARTLWISEATVKSHLLHVYDKLGAADRASAVAATMRRGILRFKFQVPGLSASAWFGAGSVRHSERGRGSLTVWLPGTLSGRTSRAVCRSPAPPGRRRPSRAGS